MRWILFLMFLNFNIQAQQLIPYLEDSKYGYSNIEGEVIIEPKYDEVGFFNDDYIAFVKRNSKWLIINRKGEVMPSFESDIMPQLSSVRNKADLKNPMAQKYDTIQHLKIFKPTRNSIQFINLQNFEATEIYDIEKPNIRLSYYRERPLQFKIGYYIAKSKSGQYCILDKNAKTVAQSRTKPRIRDNHFITYSEGNSTMLIDMKVGEKINIPYRSVIDIIENKYLIVSNRKLENTIFYLRDSPSKIGVIDWTTQLVIDTIYDNVRWTGAKDFLVQREGHYFINKDEKKITDDYLAVYRLSPSYYKAQKNNKQWVVLDNFGQETNLGEFDVIQYFQTPNYYTWRKNETTGIIDSNLRNVISYNAHSIHFTEDKNYLYIGIDDKRGLIDIDKNIIVSPNFDRCYLNRDKHISIIDNNKKGLVSIDGKILFQPIYDEIDIVKANNKTYLRPKKDGLYACYTTDMVQLSGFVSRHSNISNNNFSRYHQDGKYHLTDGFGVPLGISTKEFNKEYVESDSTFLLLFTNEDGRFVLALEEDRYITAYNEDKLKILKGDMKKGIFSFSYNDMEGVINHKNEIILNPKKREITEIYGNYILSKEDDKYYMYDLEGKLLNKDGFDFVGDWNKKLRAVGVYDQENTYEFIKDACLYGKTDTVTKKAKHIGYINEKCEFIVPLEYNFTTRYFDEYTSLTKGLEDGNKTTYLVDTTGNIVLEKTNCDYLYPLNHTDELGLYLAHYKKNVGLIDINGHEVLPTEYSAIFGAFGPNLYYVRDHDLTWHLVNRENKKMLSNINLYPKRDPLRAKGLSQKNRYFVYSDEDTKIIDQYGNVVKNIPGHEIKMVNHDDVQLINVSTPNGKYFINVDNLTEYRKY